MSVSGFSTRWRRGDLLQRLARERYDGEPVMVQCQSCNLPFLTEPSWATDEKGPFLRIFDVCPACRLEGQP